MFAYVPMETGVLHSSCAAKQSSLEAARVDLLTQAMTATLKQGQQILGVHQHGIGSFAVRCAERKSPRGSVKIPRVWSLETPPPDYRR